MPVAVRELKASLSGMLLRAQQGEVIEVTSHRKPIVRIVGIPPNAAEGLRGLIASGALSWSGGKPGLEPPVVLAASGTPVNRMVLENRQWRHSARQCMLAGQRAISTVLMAPLAQPARTRKPLPASR